MYSLSCGLCYYIISIVFVHDHNYSSLAVILATSYECDYIVMAFDRFGLVPRCSLVKRSLVYVHGISIACY